MRNALVLTAALAVAAPVFAQSRSEPERTVRLDDGSIYRGELVEYVPEDHITLRLASGAVKRFRADQVKSISGAPLGTRQSHEVATMPPSPAVAPPASLAVEYVKKARAYCAAEDFTRCLAMYDAAYRDSPISGILYDLAQVHDKLNHFKDAIALYRKYLNEQPYVDNERKQQVEERIAELKETARATRQAEQEQLRQQVAQPTENTRYVYRRRYALMASGLSLMFLSYGAALSVGAFMMGGASTESNRLARDQLNTLGGSLMTPIIGPFISGIVSGSATWAALWIVLSGSTQVAGLGMAIGGGIKKAYPATPANLDGSASLLRAEPGMAWSLNF